MAGMLIQAALALVGVATGWAYSFEPWALCWAAAFLVVLVVTGVGVFSLRFEQEGTANKALHAKAAAPGS